jgi:hypothetical protein
MTRDAAFWARLIGLIAIPGLAFGWLRGKAIGRTCRAIYADLDKAGFKLSAAEIGELIGQLNRNPKTVLDADSDPDSRAIKARHVDSVEQIK